MNDLIIYSINKNKIIYLSNNLYKQRESIYPKKVPIVRDKLILIVQKLFVSICAFFKFFDMKELEESRWKKVASIGVIPLPFFQGE